MPSGELSAPLDSQEFRYGVAYAAHLLRHAVGAAHGVRVEDALRSLAQVEPRRCCQHAILGMAVGIAETLEEIGGKAPEHEHVVKRP